jgi:hypothetical protein
MAWHDVFFLVKCGFLCATPVLTNLFIGPKLAASVEAKEEALAVTEVRTGYVKGR